MSLRAATTPGSTLQGVLWLLVLSAQCSLGQYCQTDFLSFTGTEVGNDYTFECAEGAYVSEATVSSGTDDFTGLILTCSDGEVSDVFGFYSYCDTFFISVNFWGQLSATLGLVNNETPPKASFFCYNNGYLYGTSLGPYPPEGGNSDTCAEMMASSCDDGSYVVGVTVLEAFASLFSVALQCTTIDEASCPAPDGLLVPGTTGTTHDDNNDPVSIPTPGPVMEPTTESTPEPTPKPVLARTPEPTSEPTTEPTPEPMPAPIPATGVPTQLSPTGQPHPPTPSPFSAMTLPPAATPTPAVMPTLLDNDGADEPCVDGRHSPAVQSPTPQLTWNLAAEPTTMPTRTPLSVTAEPIPIPAGQSHPPASSPSSVRASPIDKGDETPATTPPPAGPTRTPMSSLSLNERASPCTAYTVGPTVTPGFPDLYDSPPQDVGDVDGGGDASNWTKALTVSLSTVVAAATFFVFVFHRLRRCSDGGDGHDDDGNNRNGGVNGNTITCVCGCHNSIGDT
ncbi:unnamed protein product, partial [Ectocarpus sp. 4 AP-2014]